MLLLLRTGEASTFEMPFGAHPVVQIAFGYGAYDEVPSYGWYDITHDVYEIGTKRGRSSEFDDFPAGTATVVLSNDDRQYDPLNSEGPFYGRLLPNVPIRIMNLIEGFGYYPIWRGFTDGWPARYSEGGFDSRVELNCTDAFKLLAERPMFDYLDEVFHKTTPATLPHLPRPTAWFRMDEVKSGFVENAESNRHAIAEASLSNQGGLAPTSTGALQIPSAIPATGQYLSGMTIPVPRDGDTLFGAGTWTMAFLIQFEAKGNFSPDIYELVAWVSEHNETLATFQVNSAGLPTLHVHQSGGDIIATPSPATLSTNGYTIDLMDGKVHSVVGSRLSTTVYLAIDGVLVATVDNPAASGRWLEDRSSHWIGRTRAGNGVKEWPAFTIDELMFWRADGTITATRADDWHNVFVTGYGDVRSTGSAIDRALDVLEWPSAMRLLADGEIQIKDLANPVGTSVLEYLQLVTATENGRLFIGRDGRITFEDRLSILDADSVEYEFTDQNRDAGATDVGTLDGTLKLTIDDQFAYQAAKITREGGNPQEHSSTTTPPRTYEKDGLLFVDDVQALNLAQWLVYRYATPTPRSDVWEVDAFMPGLSDLGDLLSIDIGSRIRHSLDFGGRGSSVELDQYLEEIDHKITPERWTVAFNGVPVDDSEYFLWGSTDPTVDEVHGWDFGVWG